MCKVVMQGACLSVARRPSFPAMLNNSAGEGIIGVKFFLVVQGSAKCIARQLYLAVFIDVSCMCHLFGTVCRSGLFK